MRRWWPAGLVLLGAGAAVAVSLGAGDAGQAATTAVLGALASLLLSPLVFPRGGDRSAAVTVYYRPQCAYCLRLRVALGSRAGRARWLDIWADPDAAAYVRSVNGGNETVPTVVVDGVAHTNPAPALVRAALDRRPPR